jgi:hypothetical protein
MNSTEKKIVIIIIVIIIIISSWLGFGLLALSELFFFFLSSIGLLSIPSSFFSSSQPSPALLCVIQLEAFWLLFEFLFLLILAG